MAFFWVKYEWQKVAPILTHMTPIERGYYMVLMNHQLEFGPPTMEMFECMFSCEYPTLSLPFREACPTLSGFVTIPWIASEIERKSTMSKVLSDAGGKGGRPRGSKAKKPRLKVGKASVKPRPSDIDIELKQEKEDVVAVATSKSRPRLPFHLAKELRVAAFIEACKEIVAENPLRLDEDERKGFFNYWTEGNEGGKMRFEMEKVFEHGLRMDRWMKTNAKDKR